MAQQIKKKYLSDEVINYFDDQINTVEGSVTQEIADRIAGDASTLSSANSYTDSEVASVQGEVNQVELDLAAEVSRATAAENALDGRLDIVEPKVSTLESEMGAVELSIANEISRATAAEGALQSEINTEKGRIDAILLAADADKDSFVEIVTLINSIDTANDQAFAGYVLSNDAAVAALDGRLDTAEGEIDTLQSDVADHETRITALEGALAPIWAPAFKKDLTSTDISNGYIDLPHEAISGSVIAFVDRLAIHETEEFTVSVVGGVTRITFVGPLVTPGNQSLDANDNVFVKYQYLA
jgi:predicted  nucleic acid-binding Zn-ribbon protein